MIVLALAALAAVLLAASLPLWRRRGGAQRASFDPVALEDAVYDELYGGRTVRVLPAEREGPADAEQDGSAAGSQPRSATDRGSRVGAPEDLRPEHPDEGHDHQVEHHRLGGGGAHADRAAGGVVAVVAGDEHDRGRHAHALDDAV